MQGVIKFDSEAAQRYTAAIDESLLLAPHEATLRAVRNLGDILWGDKSQSLSGLDEAIRLEPLNGLFRLLRATVRLSLKDEKGANEDVLAAKQSQVAPVLLKMFEVAHGNYEPGRILAVKLEIARELSDDPYRVAEAVGLAITSGRQAEVLPIYEQLQQRFPDHPATILAKAIYLNYNGRNDEADAILDRGLEFFPFNGYLRTFRAKRLLSQGEASMALAMFERALSDANTDSRNLVKVWIIRCLIRLERVAEARQQLTELQHESPKDAAELTKESEQIAALENAK